MALKYVWDINAHMSAYAIVVDCLTENAERFYANYGFEVLCKHNGRASMFISMKTVEQLFMFARTPIQTSLRAQNSLSMY
jgi:hypothetical protein